ncbi:MAG TPA: lamin tail domain-containing protein, partial [Thermoguttaceae bacterium]|nr:lamin tail domain-containing protein [Thermoguttaceae bacterium]
MVRGLARRIAGACRQGLRPEGTTAGANRARFGRLRFEPLEPRLVLDGGALVISEFLAVNTKTLLDEDSQYRDWIEIHNPTAAAVDLEGWYLTDELTDLRQWQFPSVTVEPGGYLLVFASEKDRLGAELHTNFKLADQGEYLALVRPDGLTVEFAFDPTYPAPQVADVSYGFSADLSTQGYFRSPTPRGPNRGEPLEDPLRHVMISEIMYHPASENVLEEYVELFNGGTQPVNLFDWRIDDGVLFRIPDITLGPGEYLVVAADVDAFSAVYPEVTNVVGGWDGRLSNGSEAIELIDSAGNRVDRVRYADEGDWGVREIGPNDLGHRGWIWASAHDGGGASLELINPAMSNAYGQNWAASTEGGTPGAVNSAHADDVAPIILDVVHAPAIPRASDPVTVTARLRDEVAAGITATLHYRLDRSPDFIAVAMRDDGQSGDGPSGDGVFGAEIPALAHGAVVEFYVEATDEGGLTRTYPAPIGPEEEQLANLLYQVDDGFDPDAAWVPGSQPIYYLIMTEAERAELADIGAGGGDQNSDAQMNATFISIDGTAALVRYNAGVRNRGHGSRTGPPNNYRVNFVHDRPWKGVSALNINCRYTHGQLIGSVLHQMAGLVATEGAAVQVRVNGRDLAPSGSPTFGSYVALEALDSDFADNHFPGDGAGNAYKILRTGSNEGDLRYEGENPDAYRDTYFKMTNEADDDWSDLIHLTDVLNNAPEETYFQDVSRVIDVDQWMRYFALHALFSNYETGLYRGIGDDYAMYCGVEDPRFVLIPHDLDSILGLGSGSPSLNIFNYRGVNGLDRFFNHPDVVPLYYAALLEMIETFFNPRVLDPLFDQVLGPWAPQSRIDAMKTFVAARVANVLQQIPQKFTVGSNLPVVGGYPRTSLATIALSGTAHGADTRSVFVNGEPADWDPLTSTWQIVGPDGEPPGIVLSFRNGVSPDENYAGTLDTQLHSGDPEGYRGAAQTVQVDGSSSGAVLQGLLWFDDIFGDQPGQIPLDDKILDATLTLNVTNQGNPLALHRMLRSWDEAANWGTFGGNGIQANGVEAAVAADTTASVPDTGTLSINVTASLRAWQADPASNFGWAMLPTGTDGVVFRSSEDLNLPGRPELRLVIDDGTVVEESGVKMKPGINRVLVRAFDGPDGTGNELARESIDVWYDAGGGTNLSGTLAEGNTVLDAASGPWHVTGDVTVPAGSTLTIEPGTTVFFDQGRRITVNGRLVAEGTEYRRIRLSTEPGSGAAWNGLYFNSQQDNRLTFADMEYSTSGSRSISLSNSRILIDNVTWSGTDETILDISDSSLIVRNSVFPGTSAQTVSGHRLLASDPYMLFENNVFGVCTGEKQDVIDFSTTGSATMPRFIGNTFLGGGDDALDLDGTDGYIEGNVFMNFHRNFDPAEGESYAISTGYDGAYSSHHVIVRNVFIDCDNAALVKDRSWIAFENNTVIRCPVGINFDEPQEAGIDPGVGAYLDGNIFRQTPTPLAYFYVDDPAWGTTDITVNRSIIPAAYHGFGVGNSDEDPRLANPDGGDYGLLGGSPALGSGPAGLDMGAMVPGGASVSGAPPAITAATDATLLVAGPGVTHYKYRLDGAPDWSAETPVETPVQLAGLTDGDHAVAVIGRSAAGVWQDEADA